MKRMLFPAALCIALPVAETRIDACTRAVYTGPDGMTATGRTMDWREDPMTNLYIFPRGAVRRGAKTDDTVVWTSKYGSVSAAGYDIGICEGMNEKGLVANLLFLPESEYESPGDKRPVMGLSIWTQYVLDNFASVEEAVEALSADAFRIDSPDLPNGVSSRLHMAISDPSGDSAILEYIDSHLSIHHGKQYKVLTNSPVYDRQLAVNDYWKQIGGTTMLPGTNRSSDRFARASFYIDAVEQTSDAAVAVPTVMSVMRNVSVPYGISTPEQPHIASTRWRMVADQKNLIYYFESVLSMDTFSINLGEIDFSQGTPERVLILADGSVYVGDATRNFRPVSRPFEFLFGI